MLPATSKLCAAISYRHLRNMTGESGLGQPCPAAWDTARGSGILSLLSQAEWEFLAKVY